MGTLICAVIPAYNEEAQIAHIVSAALEYVDTVLVVNDGSQDNTALQAKVAGAKLLNHSENLGKGRSLRDGFDWACANEYSMIISLDADGQHLPAEISAFIKAVESGSDLVVGNRMTELDNMPWLRKNTNLFMSWLVSKVAGTNVPDTQCGFRLLTVSCWQAVGKEITSCGFDFESDIIIQAGRMGFKIDWVKVSTIYADEASKIRPVRDTLRFFYMILKKLFGKRPPRIKA